MSSRRSRRAGTRISMVLRRKSRSWRKRPAATSAPRSALVAEISRTSERIVREEPTRSNSPVSSTRSSLPCCEGGTLPISSRKSVPPWASSKRPTRSARASVNAPAHVAEELALEDALRDAAGVQRHEGPGRALRGRVQGARDDALAAAVLAGDEHVGVGRAHARDDVQHRAHRGRAGDHRGLRLVAQDPVLGLEAVAAAQRAAEGDLRAQGREQPRVVPRLLHEVARAAAHRLDGEVDACPRPS